MAAEAERCEPSCIELYALYTMGHKKRATSFGIITPMFRGGFLHFLHQWKQEKILYRWITKFATLP